MLLRLLLIHALLAGPVLALTDVAIAQTAPPRVRRLPWNPDVPIPSRLLPDDDVVVVSLVGDIDYITPGHTLTVKEVIDDAAVRADLVAVIDIDAVVGVLVRGESWVNTRLSGTVREILRARTPGRFQKGQRVDGHFGAGEVTVGQVRVRVGDPVNLPVGRAYLLFLDDNHGLLETTHAPLLIEDGKLRYPFPIKQDGQQPDPLQGLTVPAVGKVAQEATMSWLCGKCER